MQTFWDILSAAANGSAPLPLRRPIANNDARKVLNCAENSTGRGMQDFRRTEIDGSMPSTLPNPLNVHPTPFWRGWVRFDYYRVGFLCNLG
jgi:hypothetical protein